MINFGRVRPGSTLEIYFESFASSTGAPITITGLATSDILVYKDGGTTQRASASGFTLLDTDGIDFDGITGIHGFSIDLSDNTTADFWAAGSRYTVVVSTITVDSQTMSFIAATFRIGYESAILDTTIATLSSQTSFTLTSGPAEDDALNGREVIIHDAASAVQIATGLILDYTGSTKTVTLAAAPTFTIAAKDNISVMGLAPLQPTVLGKTLDVSSGGEAGVDWANVGSPTTTVNLSGTTIKTATDLATAIDAVDNYVDTEVAAMQADVTTLLSRLGTPSNLGGGATISANLSDIESQTDDIGVAGAGLTNINLPNQTMDIVGNITGNLSGSVGSVAGNVGGIAGTTQTLDALQTTLNSAHGSGSWATATGFSTHSAADVWAVATRVLTAGTNIALAKGTGVTGFNDLDAAGVRTAVGLASANLDTQLTAIVADTNELQTDNADGGRTDLLVDAIKAKTDSLTFTVAAMVDANVIDWKGATAPAMTGDAFARIGAPVGASISADIAAVQADLPQRITKNMALAAFPFFMVLSSDHVTGATGLTVTATRSLDGAAFASCANAVSEIANGWYKIDLDAADLNGTTVALKFTAATADARMITIITEPT